MMTGELATNRIEKTTLLPLSCTPDTDDRVHTGHRYTDLGSEEWGESKASDELGFSSDGILLGGGRKGTRADRESWHCPERKEEPWVVFELAFRLIKSS
jgi:hypothetical protein